MLQFWLLNMIGQQTTKPFPSKKSSKNVYLSLDWDYVFDFSEVTVREIIMHPQYSAKKLINDFAILRTNEEIQFSKTANAACLPE